MANIRQRDNGLYEARISFKGKYFSVYDRDLYKLKTKITKKIKELSKEYKNEKTLANKLKENLTLKCWYEKWLEEDKKPFVSKDTMKSITSVFNNHILQRFENYKITQLTKTVIQKFLNDIEKSRTKDLITLYFKSCITQAYKERLIEFNPFDTVKIGKKTISEKVGFSAKQQMLILEYLKTTDKDFYYIILFLLCLGCRRIELQRIQKEDISKSLILIHQTKPITTTRYIKISNEFEKVIKENLHIIKQFSADWTTKKFGRVLKALKIKGSLHSLRHSFATNHFYLGTQTKQVQVWLGHSSINMTMDIYTNLDPKINAQEEKEEIKKLYNNLYYYSE